MRFKSILLTILVLAVPFFALADSSSLELQKKIMFDQKKLVVMHNMNLTESEAKAFWPIYEKYQEDLFRINQRGAKLIFAYASAYQNMSDSQAIKLINEYYDIQYDRLAVMKKLVAAVDEVLPGTKAFRYMQIEAKLSAIGRYELAKEIPLMP